MTLPDTEALSTRAASAARWVAAAKVCVTLLRMIQVAVLARLLPSADFGLMGMALVLVGFGEMFALGMSGAVIHSREDDPKRLSTVYWTNVLLGCLAFGVLQASAPIAARFYREPGVADVLFWASFQFLVTPFGALFRLLYEKNLQFRRVAEVEIAATLAGTAVAVTVAATGGGVFALVLGYLATEIVATLAFVITGQRRWPITWRLRLQDLRGYAQFSLFNLGFNLVDYLRGSVDKLLIGRLLGADALGYYTMAWNLMLRPLSLLTQLTNRVSFPLFAEIQDAPALLVRAYLRVTRYLASVSAPAYLGLFAVATPFLALYLGPGWDATTPVFEVLVLLGLIMSLESPTGVLLLARGRPDLGLYVNLFALAATLGSIMVAARWGIVGVAVGLVGLEVVVFAPIRIWLRHVVVAMPATAPFRAALPFLAVAAVMLTAAMACDHLLSGLSHWARLIAALLLGALIYGGLLLYKLRPFLVEMKSLLRPSR